MKLNDIYSQIIAFAGMQADAKGYVSTILDNEPVIVAENRLVLPTSYQLRDCNDRERIVFHPLAEKIIAGESHVVKKLRLNINVLLNRAISVLGQSLLHLVASPAEHKKLSPEQSQILLKVRDADQTAVANFGLSAVAAMKEAPDRAFVNIYLCRGGTHNGKKYSRLGVASFPYFKNLKEGKAPGKVRQKDYEIFSQLLEFMFSEIATEDSYNVGSDSTTAPFLQALMLTAAQLASRINELVDLYENFLPFDDTLTKESLKFPLEWLDTIEKMEELGPLIRTVPPQNDGAIAASVETSACLENPSVPVVSMPVQTQPMHQPVQTAPEVKKTKGGLDFKSMMGGVAAQQQQQMMPMQGGMYPAYQQPQMMPMQQGYPGYQQPMMPGMMPMGMAPQQRMPSWSMPQPEQTMVMTPQGPMLMSVAMQLNLPYQIMQQNPMPGNPTWSR